MPTVEKERLALYQRLNSTIGPDHAETLMKYLPAQKWTDLATKEDLRLMAKELRGEMQAGFAAMESRFAQMKSRFAQMESKFAHMDGKFAHMESRFAQMESRFAQMESRFAQMESKFAQQTRTTVLALAGFAATIWASMLATVLVVT